MSALSKRVERALGAYADPNAEADVRVRLADPNGQKADEIAVRLGRPIGVALTNHRFRTDKYTTCKLKDRQIWTARGFEENGRGDGGGFPGMSMDTCYPTTAVLHAPTYTRPHSSANDQRH